VELFGVRWESISLSRMSTPAGCWFALRCEFERRSLKGSKSPHDLDHAPIACSTARARTLTFSLLVLGLVIKNIATRYKPAPIINA